jgi:enediyne biosynthesis protein E4
MKILCAPLHALWFLTFFLFPGSALLAQSSIRFEEVAQKSGLKMVVENSPTPQHNQIETMIAGIGLIDYNRDGFPDVYVVNGASIPSMKKESAKYYNRLFCNNGDGTFTDVTQKAGVAGAGYGMGMAVGDYDNDGWPDLFLANVTDNQLFHNNGDGTFSEVTARAGLAGAEFKGAKMWSVAAGWIDFDRDGRLDLFVSNYCRWRVNEDPPCQVNGQRFYCNPNLYEPLHNSLYRNNGDGTFTDVSVETRISAHHGRGMGVAFADLDGDGFTDIFVANDKSPNFIFKNLEGKKFEEVALPAGVAFGEEGSTLSGMGVDLRDVNNDGRADIFHTAVELETFPLYLNLGGWLFHNVTASSGLGRLTAQMSGWSNGIYDFDNDGWKDLFVARSNVLDNVSLAQPHRRYPEPNTIFHNLGDGRFQDVSASAGEDFRQEDPHRGAAFGDLDNDGRVDAIVTVLGGTLKLFHNVSPPMNHWLTLKLEGKKSNRMGLGARVRIITPDGATQYNHATTSVGYAASSDSRIHFGLGPNRQVKELEILWPSGLKQVVNDVMVDQVISIAENSNEPRRTLRNAEGVWRSIR